MGQTAMNEEPARSRLTSIDWLRGLVMVLMLIDHTRDFVHAESFWHSPTDLGVISSATFLTRWITHYCAPIFVFLAGLSASLQLQAGHPMPAVRRLLFTRGLWLVVLELTLVHLGWTFSWQPWVDLGIAQVIWAIGFSMVLLSAMLFLSWRWILAIGLVLVLGHNLLDPFTVPRWAGPGHPLPGGWNALWAVLHQGGVIGLFGAAGPRLYIGYPLIPWPGVMALGYCLGRAYGLPPERRRRILAWLGLASIAGFILLRALTHCGDAKPWSFQTTGFRTLLSFVNCTKYPPSLLYLLMTLGPALLLLAWRERSVDSAVDRVLVTFGRVPLFFYLLQWPTAHLMGLLFSALGGRDWRYLVHLQGPEPAAFGFGLWAVYLAWALGLALLYPLCRWFAGVKRRRRDWWLSYL
jgi:uncharacterized membrane protein